MNSLLPNSPHRRGQMIVIWLGCILVGVVLFTTNTEEFMPIVLALMLLGLLGSKIPTDKELARQLEDSIRERLHPATVQVVIKRPSPLSTTVERLEITVSGFKADSLPMGPATEDAAPAKTVAAVAPADGDNPPPATKGMQIRVIDASVRCTDFTVNAMTVRELALDGRELCIPFASLRKGTLEIAAAESATGHIILPQEGLTAYLRTQKLPLAMPEIAITPAGCVVSGTTRTAIGIPVSLGGRLVARNGAVLYFDDPRLKVSIVPVPGAIAQRILKDINPLTDLNAAFPLPAPLTITATTHQNGALRFDARFNFKPPVK